MKIFKVISLITMLLLSLNIKAQKQLLLYSDRNTCSYQDSVCKVLYEHVQIRIYSDSLFVEYSNNYKSFSVVNIDKPDIDGDNKLTLSSNGDIYVGLLNLYTGIFAIGCKRNNTLLSIVYTINDSYQINY